MFVWIPFFGQMSPVTGNNSVTFLLLVTVIVWVGYDRLFSSKR